MRTGPLVVALLVALPLGAQEKAAPKKKAARTPPPAHHQASKDEIRRFNELGKKKQKGAK
ncbi:MAG TPA: hypothetical protein VGI18_07220 [Burkholderiales bacterium]